MVLALAKIHPVGNYFPKKNHVLLSNFFSSSSSLNVGRNLGQSLVRSNMEKFPFNSAVRGYHVYKVVWKPTIGEKLQADQELGNEADKFAVKVVKNNEIVGHLPREYPQTL